MGLCLSFLLWPSASRTHFEAELQKGKAGPGKLDRVEVTLKRHMIHGKKCFYCGGKVGLKILTAGSCC